MKIAVLSVATLFFTLLSGFTLAADPGYVVIDITARHVATFISVPKTFPPTDLQKLNEKIAQTEGISLMSWDEFKGDPAKHIKSQIRRNDYMEVDVVRGLSQLLERYERTPFGLTWNGGLAVTGNDYQYSARSYKAFTNNPNTFSREADRRKDPVHPDNHIEPLLRR
jgi:hypothetical protein